MAEEDNFDIDIYGDGGQGSDNDEHSRGAQASAQHSGDQAGDGNAANQAAPDGAAADETPQTVKGVKRKEESDDRPLDPGATAALFISDLSWWITDDEIRGWANEVKCEDELEEVTFSEHKVNGKSKGLVYALFSSPQAATAAKRLIDSFAEGTRYKQRFGAAYTNPLTNPFKTLPKDPGARNAPAGRGSGSFNGNNGGGGGQSNFNQGGFRGGRGNFRGGAGQNSGGFGRGGMGMGGGFQGNMGFQGGPNMGGFGGFNGRGGMPNAPRGGGMGMRGGRGGGNGGGAMNMMPMPMPMPMPMGMPMPQMNSAVGMPGGFQNPGYYPQGGDANWNPHGAKRTRQE